MPFCAVAPVPEKSTRTLVDADAEAAFDRVERVVTRLRNLRQESGLPQRQRIPAAILSESDAVRGTFAALAREVERVAGLSELRIEAPAAYTVPTQAAVHDEPDLQVVLPLEGVIDVDAERSRVEKDLAKARKELSGYERKLGNEGYVNKAPADVVEETRQRAARCRERIEGLEGSLERLSAA